MSSETYVDLSKQLKSKALSPVPYLFIFTVLFFSLSVIAAQKKTLWVDECYSYYGIQHSNIHDFLDSILSGINFSPPFYFLFNYLLSHIYEFEISSLRIESLFFILLGIILCFLASRNLFGNLSAFVGTLLLASQSNLLFEQSMEARQYAMFFAASAWTVYLYSLPEGNKGRHYRLLLFTAHLILCQIHYTGIIFSVLAASASAFSNYRNGFFSSLPTQEILSWSISIPIYLFLLSKQSSHLNVWPKANGFEDLISLYSDSFQVISILVPMLICALAIRSSACQSKNSANRLSTINVLLLSLLWLTVPITIWVLSHISPVNLFKDRYFIPIEVALIVLLSFCINRLFKISSNIHSTKFNITILSSTTLLSVFFLLIGFKHTIFAMDPSRNYYKWLVFDKKRTNGSDQYLYYGDHLFFPNYYQYGSSMNQYLVVSQEHHSIYFRFSHLIANNLMLENSIITKTHYQVSDHTPSSSYLNRKLPPIRLNVYSPIMAYPVTIP